MDAYAYELKGDLGKAKLLFLEIVQTCTDYHILLRFYKQPNSFQECEALSTLDSSARPR